MRTPLIFILILLLTTIVQGQPLTIKAGDTSGLSAHRIFNPPDHVECGIFSHPIVYNLDLNQDGIDDLFLKCDYSYGALGLGSYYLTAQAFGSNEICYGTVDSSQCYNGYKPLYLAHLFNAGDTITDEMTYGQSEIIFSKVFWIMKDTCSYTYSSSGMKYLAVRLNSNGNRGLAWVSLDLFAASGNGYSADVKETGYKSAITSVREPAVAGMSVYPVPSDGLVTIEIPDWQQRRTLVVCDLTGKVITQTAMTSKTTQISLQRGFYLMKLTDGNNGIITRKCTIL